MRGYLKQGEHYQVCSTYEHDFDELHDKLGNANLATLGLTTKELDCAIFFFDPNVDSSVAGLGISRAAGSEEPNKEVVRFVHQKLQEAKKIMEDAKAQPIPDAPRPRE